MPDPDERPMHTIARNEFMEVLAGSTNLRMVRDRTQPNGYRVVTEAFPGWENLPVQR
jgi:hypothetical protein